VTSQPIEKSNPRSSFVEDLEKWTELPIEGRDRCKRTGKSSEFWRGFDGGWEWAEGMVEWILKCMSEDVVFVNGWLAFIDMLAAGS